MRILLIDVNCKKGSTGKIVYDLYKTLRACGHEAAICYGRGLIVNEPEIFRFSSKLEVYLHALLTRITGLTGCFSPIATHRLIRFINRFNPDVVHIHELHAYFVNIVPVMNYLAKNKIKTIWTFHCEFMYTGKCGYSYECEKWKSQCGCCPKKREYPTSWFFDFTGKMQLGKIKSFMNFNNLTIVTPSKWLADRVKQSFLNKKEIVVIPNGIDTSVFKPYDTSAIKLKHNVMDKNTIVHVTGMFEDERKGGNYVIELAVRLPEINFFIVGNKTEIPDLPRNVTAVGRTENQQELALYYSMADLFIITSELENFPTVCIEALCCGTPVVGFVGGGTSETAPNPYGVFVPYSDCDALEEAVKSCIYGELDIKKECAAYGNEKYSKEKMVQEYLKLYEK